MINESNTEQNKETNKEKQKIKQNFLLYHLLNKNVSFLIWMIKKTAINKYTQEQKSI